MRLFPLAYLAGLLPLICIHLTYWLAASHGQVPWCIPYIDSCTSISATGREPPAFFVFKGVMIPAAVLLMSHWIINAWWLRTLGSDRVNWLRGVKVLGILAGGGLIFYSVYLGSIGDEYRLYRHTGVLTFFGFSFFAQLVITWLLGNIGGIRRAHPFGLRLLQSLMLLVLLVGLANLIIGYVNPTYYDTINDAFAWISTLLLCLHVLAIAELWRRTELALSFRVKSHY